MKKIKILLGSMLLASVMFVSCEKDSNKVENPILHEMKVESKAVSILEGEIKIIKIVSGNGGYQVTSDNDNVSVSEKAGIITITGQKAGKSIISVTDSKGKKTTIEVTIAGFVLSKIEVSLEKNQSETIVIESGSGSYTSSSDNEAVATAQISGTNIIVTAVTDGIATITITDTQTNKAQHIKVIVNTPIPESYYRLNNDKTTLEKWLNDELTTLDMEHDPVLSKVTSIGARAFLGTKLTNITLPNGLKNH